MRRKTVLVGIHMRGGTAEQPDQQHCQIQRCQQGRRHGLQEKGSKKINRPKKHIHGSAPVDERNLFDFRIILKREDFDMLEKPAALPINGSDRSNRQPFGEYPVKP